MAANGLRPVFSTHTNPAELKSTVIVGAGIIGCATAYYLATSGSTRPDTIHLIEAAEELFLSASGKAGGFLASDWFGSETAPLGALSFQLHRELAQQNDGQTNWGYSRSTGTSFVQGRQRVDMGDDFTADGTSRANLAATHQFFQGDGPAWLRRKEGDRVTTIGADDSTAQVDPLRLSRWLLKESVMKGVRLHHPARAVRVSKDEQGNMSAIRISHASGSDLKIPCTRLLIAAGAWSGRVFEQLFPSARVDIPISQLAGYSVVVKSPRWAKEHESSGCHSVFTTMRSGFSPEIFSRLGEEIYVAGLNDPSLSLPDLPTNEKVDESKIAELTKVATSMLGKDGTDVSDLQVLREGLCFRPVTGTGAPILTRIGDDLLGGISTQSGSAGGVFLAAGHGPWGISLSLGTGKIMQEMIEDLNLSADVSDLHIS